MINKSLISFNRDHIYTSLENPDLNFSDQKLESLIRLTNELGRFGYILDSDVIRYLDISDIEEYFNTVIPILYDVYMHTTYVPSKEKINLEDWKKRHTSDFYNSGDFRFMIESANRLNLKGTYLFKMNKDDLYKIFLSMVESPIELTKEQEKEVVYLSSIFKIDNPEIANNKFSKSILKLYNPNYKPNDLNDFSEFITDFYKYTRNERRLVLEKLEILIKSNGLENIIRQSKIVSKSDWKVFFNRIHPGDYKKVFPLTYEFYLQLLVKKVYNVSKSSQSAYNLAYELLCSDPEEFVNKFEYLMLKAEEENNGSEADIASLLCTGKLEIDQLLNILECLQKKEFGISRFYGSGEDIVKKSSKCFDIKLVPVVKEFIFKGLSIKYKTVKATEELSGKLIWLDPVLKKYDYFSNNIISYSEKYPNRIKLDNEIRLVTYWSLYGSYIDYSYTSPYLWKGVGNDFKLVDLKSYRSDSTFKYMMSHSCDVPKLISQGYKYIIFYNRTTYRSICNKSKDLDNSVLLKIMDKNANELFSIKSDNCIRNRFGGIIDLSNGDIWIFAFDISELPTYNGNLEEAMVRCIFDSFRFSVYDYLENYYTSNGAIIVDSNYNCDIEYTLKEYENRIKNNDKIIIF